VELSSATGSAGVDWDLWNISGALTLEASPTTNGRFTISLASLLDDSPGQAANFDPHRDYDWSILHADAGITGFDASKFAVDASGFKNDLAGGHFFLQSTSNDLSIHFSPVPEPAVIALWLLGAHGMIAGRAIARRRCR